MTKKTWHERDVVRNTENVKKGGKCDIRRKW